MKKQIKYLFATALFSLLITCEKDVDNTIPGNPKERIEAHRQDFKRVFTSNSMENNGKIWISDAQYYTDLYNALRKKKQSLPFFVALNPKKNNNTNIYVTVRHEQFQSDSPKDEFGLLSNPNQYGIKGTFKLSFSISRQSVLSSLREKEVFDFDFDVYRYNQDSIHLKAIYEIANQDIIFRSYDFNDNVKAFFGACQNLFDYNDFDYDVYSSWYESKVSFKIEDSKKSILNYFYLPKKGIFMLYFPTMIKPYYDKQKKVFAFKIQPYAFHIFERYAIKYLTPVSATEDKMVFSGSGKKLDDQDNPTEEDETYTITFEKL